MENVEVYSVGLVYCSACAPDEVGAEEVELAANRKHPTGVTPWKVSDEGFRTGEPNPCPCDTDAGRRHWLLVC